MSTKRLRLKRLSTPAIISLLLLLGAATFASALVVAEAVVERRELASYRAIHSSWSDGSQGPSLRIRQRLATEGAPTIVFVSGFGASLEVWDQVVEALPGTFGYLSYDRAGIGMSEPGEGARDAAHIADELFALLQATSGRSSFTFVCHSLGAQFCTVLAARHPAIVGSLVLVDPFHPDEPSRVSPTAREEDAKILIGYPRSIAARTTFGLHRASLWTDLLNPPEALSANEVISQSSRHWRGVEREGAFVDLETANETRKAMQLLRDVPVLVLSAELPEHPETRSDRAVIQELHKQWAAFSKSGSVRVVEGVSHNTFLTSAVGAGTVVRAAIDAVESRNPNLMKKF